MIEMAECHKQEMVEAFKNDATPGVQASIYCSKRYTKENGNKLEQLSPILKRHPEEDFIAQQELFCLRWLTG
jgi:hypothetical protein